MKILRTPSLESKFTGSYNKRVYPNAFQYSGAIKSSNKFSSPEIDNEKPYNITN